MSFNREVFTHFLVQAKQQTYAYQGDEASVTPLLNGSKQLEYHLGDFFYRDIYFGSAFFVGQETVEYQGHSIWSMVYSGGVILPNASAEQIGQIYAFLRNALRVVDTKSLYRGPEIFQENLYSYKNEYNGTFDNFRGYEIIEIDNQKSYELHYNGGILR
ncbi:MAG: hypothetical protein JWM44_3551 [Bacilli bacterium]|nr:hypothetical protein [Bacilli bacterium]